MRDVFSLLSLMSLQDCSCMLEIDQLSTLRSFPPQLPVDRTPLHLYTAAQLCHKSLWLFCHVSITEFFRKWMGEKSLPLRGGNGRLKDYCLASTGNSWCIQLVCCRSQWLGGDSRLKLEGETAKTELHFFKKLKWSHALPLFAEKEISQ